MLIVVDYGMGNLTSVVKAFRRLGHVAKVSSVPAELAAATRLILPGVGHFGRGMENLRARGLIAPLEARIADGVPLLGICLGMQLLTRRSEEGEGAGLGWVDAATVRLQPAPQRVPHFGWNTVAVTRPDPWLGPDVDGASFYFAHSYGLADCEPDAVLATTRYGSTEFPSIVRKGNVMAAQFHPEKSHGRGLALLERFMGLA